MSLHNFVLTIWSAEILKTFEKLHVLASLTNRNYEGEISDLGDSVKIHSIGDITISNYTKNSTSITPELLQSAQTILLIDTAKYFAFKIDDVDAAQANVSVMEEAMRKAAFGLSDTVDLAIAALYDQADTTITDATMDSDLAIDTIARTAEALNINNVTTAGRWLALPPWAITKLVLAKILNTEGVSNDSTFNNGFVGRMMGFDVFMTNNLTQSGTTPNFTTQGMAGVREAITFAEQIVSVEAFRPESSFSDAMKGLHVYGMKVVQPKGLVRLALTFSAETT